jgi:hypothetical protein
MIEHHPKLNGAVSLGCVQVATCNTLLKKKAMCDKAKKAEVAAKKNMNPIFYLYLDVQYIM